MSLHLQAIVDVLAYYRLREVMRQAKASRGMTGKDARDLFKNDDAELNALEEAGLLPSELCWSCCTVCTTKKCYFALKVIYLVFIIKWPDSCMFTSTGKLNNSAPIPKESIGAGGQKQVADSQRIPSGLPGRRVILGRVPLAGAAPPDSGVRIASSSGTIAGQLTCV